MLTETETKKKNQNILKQNSFINILFTYVFEQKQQNRTIAQLCKFEQKAFYILFMMIFIENANETEKKQNQKKNERQQ